MSADNGIYIGYFSDGETRVIHAQAIDNLWYPNDENAEMIVDYFKDAEVFNNRMEAGKKAFEMEDDIRWSDFPILEYGISTLVFSKSFKEYLKEAEEQRKFNAAMGAE
jgi:hypothetical protein